MTWTNHTNNSYPEQLITKHFWHSGNYEVSLSIISLHVVVTFLDQRRWIWKRLQLVCGWVDVGWMDIYPYINMHLNSIADSAHIAHTSKPSISRHYVKNCISLTTPWLMRLSFQFEPKCTSLVRVNICISRNFMILHHSHEKYTNIFWVAGARLTSCLAVHQYKLYASRLLSNLSKYNKRNVHH